MAANSFFMAPAGCRGALVGRNEAKPGRKPTTKHSSDDVFLPPRGPVEIADGQGALGPNHARKATL